MAISCIASTAPKLAVLILFAGLWLQGCAGFVTQDLDSMPALDGVAKVSIESVDVLAVSNEMRRFLERHVLDYASEFDRLQALNHAINHPSLLGYKYHGELTYTASESYLNQRGNCVAFANMLVALARAAGLRASFQEVEFEPEWSARKQRFLLSQHINVKIKAGRRSYTVDVSEKRLERATKYTDIADLSAKAHYYNNLAVDALLQEDIGRAYAYLRKGLESDPKLSFLWANLGVIYKHNRQYDDAEWAYKQAMRINPNDDMAMNNLSSLFQETGRVDEAKRLKVASERRRKNNPYYLLLLSGQAIQQEDYSGAIKILKRAVSLHKKSRHKKEYRFYLTLAKAYYKLGDLENAQLHYMRARETAGSKRLRDRLSQPLAELMKQALDGLSDGVPDGGPNGLSAPNSL